MTIFKKGVSFVAVCALLFALLAVCVRPVRVHAAETIDLTTPVSGTGYSVLADAIEITANGSYLVTGSTAQHTLKVAQSATQVSIILNGVSIEIEGGSSALEIAAGSTVALELQGDNRLSSKLNGAAIQVPAGAALSISGSGSLTADAFFGAGIGGDLKESAGSVTINSGVVNASSQTGAGIGGGGGLYNGGDGGDVTINGGTVVAKGADGAGIGGGAGGQDISGFGYNGGAGGSLTITGGSVTATTDWFGAGIGGGRGGRTVNGPGDFAPGGTGGAGSNIVISGGTVTASSAYGRSIGGGNGGSSYASDGEGGAGGSLIITGGSIDAGASGIGGGPGSPSGVAATITNGSENVYLTTITLSGAGVGTRVTALVGPSSYGTKDVQTGVLSKLYLYLPENTVTTGATTPGGAYVGTVTTNNNGTAAETFAPRIAPTITGPAAMNVTEGYAATATQIYTVAGEPAPSVNFSTNNAKLSWNAASGTIGIAAGLPAGTYTATLTASNGVGPDVVFTFTLTVQAAASSVPASSVPASSAPASSVSATSSAAPADDAFWLPVLEKLRGLDNNGGLTINATGKDYVPYYILQHLKGTGKTLTIQRGLDTFYLTGSNVSKLKVDSSYRFTDLAALGFMQKPASGSGTGSRPASRDIAATGVTLDRESAEIEVGATLTLRATVAPADATDKSVGWSSSDESVAKVASGVVTGVAEGTAEITVKTANGKEAKCRVTVLAAEEPEPIQVEGITLSHKDAELKKGETVQLSAAVTPEDAEDKGVVWSSSDDSVATVDQSGKVTAVGPGEATITASAANGKAATCAITVTGGGVPLWLWMGGGVLIAAAIVAAALLIARRRKPHTWEEA